MIYQSIKSGYIKKLDTTFWFSLENHVARRMYRFLDKRLYRSPAFSMNLRRLAFEHVGLSRQYNAGQIKRKLRPALDELTGRRFLKEYRFERVADGEALFVLRTQGAEQQPELPLHRSTGVPSHQPH